MEHLLQGYNKLTADQETPEDFLHSLVIRDPD